MAQVGPGTAVVASARACAWPGCRCGGTQRVAFVPRQGDAVLVWACAHHADVVRGTQQRDWAISVEPDWGAPPPPAASRRASGTKGR